MNEQAEQQEKLGRPTIEELLDLLITAGNMKRLPRTGWRLAGIKDCESVADHSFRVVLLALALAELVEGVDRFRLLKMAILHELPESLVTDLPLPSVKLLGRQAKYQAEQEAWEQLLPAGPWLDDWRGLWDEFEARESKEAKLVRVIDKFEVLLQAYEYERAGYRNLDDFWSWGEDYFQDQELELFKTVFRELKLRRAKLNIT